MKYKQVRATVESVLSICKRHDCVVEIRGYDNYFWFEEMVRLNTANGCITPIRECSGKLWCGYNQLPNEINKEYNDWVVEKKLLGSYRYE